MNEEDHRIFRNWLIFTTVMMPTVCIMVWLLICVGRWFER